MYVTPVAAAAAWHWHCGSCGATCQWLFRNFENGRSAALPAGGPGESLRASATRRQINGEGAGPRGRKGGGPASGPRPHCRTRSSSSLEFSIPRTALSLSRACVCVRARALSSLSLSLSLSLSPSLSLSLLFASLSHISLSLELAFLPHKRAAAYVMYVVGNSKKKIQDSAHTRTLSHPRFTPPRAKPNPKVP